jgi:hypothetical protein
MDGIAGQKKKESVPGGRRLKIKIEKNKIKSRRIGKMMMGHAMPNPVILKIS